MDCVKKLYNAKRKTNDREELKTKYSTPTSDDLGIGQANAELVFLIDYIK